MKKVLPVLALLTAAIVGPAQAQDRAAELEARQRARAEMLRQRGAELEYRALARGGWLDGYGGGCVEIGYPAGPGGYPAFTDFERFARGLPGGSGWTDRSGWGQTSRAALPRAGIRGPICPPGYQSPYVTDLFGYRWIPNPYDDWREIWSRGWTEGEGIPPYHRFQYRFFPETLPDPTRGGYITPGEWWSTPTPRTPVPTPGGMCARIRVDTGDAAREVLVELPVFGATTPEALRSVIVDRLQRGGGVAIRSVDGYVLRFPPFDAIRDLAVTDC